MASLPGNVQEEIAGRKSAQLLSWFAYSNLHILLVAAGLIAGSSLLAGISLSKPLLVAGCCGAFLVYQLDRCWLSGPEDAINQPFRLAWVAGHPQYVWGATIISAGIGFTATLFLSPDAIIAGGLLALGGMFYLLPLFPDKSRPKSKWYIKPLAISSVWAASAVLLPMIEAKIPLSGNTTLLYFYRLLFIVPNVLLIDLQDTAGDSKAGITSIAMLVSEQKLRMISGSIAAAAVVFGGIAGIRAEWPACYYIDLVGPAILMWFSFKNAITHPFYRVMLDMVIAWPLLTTLCIFISR